MSAERVAAVLAEHVRRYPGFGVWSHGCKCGWLSKINASGGPGDREHAAHVAAAVAAALDEPLRKRVEAWGLLSARESAELRLAHERDKWAGEWNSLPTAVDRVLAAVLARLADHGATGDGQAAVKAAVKARTEALRAALSDDPATFGEFVQRVNSVYRAAVTTADDAGRDRGEAEPS